MENEQPLRLKVSRLPNSIEPIVTNVLAYTIYLPLARMAWLGERAGLDVGVWPLSAYRHYSICTMKTDSRDRFGTPLEQTFSKDEIRTIIEFMDPRISRSLAQDHSGAR